MLLFVQREIQKCHNGAWLFCLFLVFRQNFPWSLPHSACQAARQQWLDSFVQWAASLSFPFCHVREFFLLVSFGEAKKSCGEEHLLLRRKGVLCRQKMAFWWCPMFLSSSFFNCFVLFSHFDGEQICQHWTWQCFWNYMDWDDITDYIFLCLLMGSDFQVKGVVLQQKSPCLRACVYACAYFVIQYLPTLVRAYCAYTVSIRLRRKSQA